MDKTVITLSSDDESDSHHLQRRIPRVILKRTQKKPNKKKETNFTPGKIPPTTIRGKNGVPLNKSPEKNCLNVSKENPEVVALVDCLDKSPDVNDWDQDDYGSNGVVGHVQSHSKSDVIDVDTKEDDSDMDSYCESKNDEKPEELRQSQTVSADSNTETTTQRVRPEKIDEVPVKENLDVRENNADEDSNQNPNFFAEFVEFCGSLETIATDRTRLMKKLMKRYEEAEPGYVESQEFRDLIQKFREKINQHNLYLIAKNITAELSFRKKIKVIFTGDENMEINDGNEGDIEIVEEIGDKKLNKRAKFIRKILKKLEEMGNKIRELEVEEVDLSDEEESSYIRLQRYRERYCMIYKRLCKYTNEVPNLDQLDNRKICFTESKYPTVNKCIEVWLNKTKRFPDFTDIMKLLESQSSSLGLPPNRESLRGIAVEIFQQVGAMLQRRRKYDLWDSFCGFLGSKIDPAVSDPALEKILQGHLETRIKKEQEIFQHYTELQERERLEPEEVPEDEANCSPVESGNEDDKEIEEIENDIVKRLDLTIEEDVEREAGERNESINNRADDTEQEGTKEQKESKNNYKNCKSLRWRSENSGKSISESGNSEPEFVEEKVLEPGNKDSPGSDDDLMTVEESDKNDSDLEVLEEEVHHDTSRDKKLERAVSNSPLKRTATSVKKSPGKKKCTNHWENEDNENRLGKSFDVQYCQVFAGSAFECFSEEKKNGEKRKVFRDMTNVSRLMRLHGKNLNASGWFAPSLFRPVFRESIKPSWKRRFKVSLRMVDSKDEKCALNHDEKTGKSMKSNARRESGRKSMRNNSERGRDDRHDFFSGRGGESHEDDDKDRNRKNGRAGNDVSENKPEEEEEEDEEERDEGEGESKSEGTEHSGSKEKTEERRESVETDWPLEVLISNKETDSPNISKNLNKNRKVRKAQERNAEKKEEVEILEDKKDVEILESKEEIEILEKDGEANKNTRELENAYFLDNSKDNDAKKYFFKVKNGEQLTEKKSKRTETKANTNEVIEVEKPTGNTSRKRQWKSLNQEVAAKKENKRINKKRTQQNDVGRATTARKSFPVEILQGGAKKKSQLSPLNEERVKQFLMHPPSSISITPPRKLASSKPPSDAVLQALATLRSLKGVSATLVKGKPKNEEEVMVIEDAGQAGSRSALPVIPNAKSAQSTTPKILTVEGSVSGFEDCPQEVKSGEKSEFDSSSLRISNVWGGLPNNFMQALEVESMRPSCSRENSQRSWNAAEKKKCTKKKVEYVVIE